MWERKQRDRNRNNLCCNDGPHVGIKPPSQILAKKNSNTPSAEFSEYVPMILEPSLQRNNPLFCTDEFCPNPILYQPKDLLSNKISPDALAIQQGNKIITRKFALLPEPSTRKIQIYREIKDRMVKTRDLENIYLKIMVDKFYDGTLSLNSFARESMIHIRREIYDPLNLSQVLAHQFKSFELKERMKRCCIQYPYHALRNWLIRNENLKVLSEGLITRIYPSGNSLKLFSSFPII